MLDRLQAGLQRTSAALAALEPRLGEVVTLGETIVSALENGGTLFTAGNGGSAAQALHLTEELIGRYEADRPPIRSVSLVGDPSAMSCIANDFGFETVFERPLRGLARPGDVLLAMSTSGQSENILRCLQAARELGVTSTALLGRDGGPALALCEQAIVVPAQDSATIQDIHQVVIHLLCEMIEASVLES
ncbi:MAG: SIS domain-containing protein [Phycisphaerales bacterium]|nr:SIS domain-containing protein [Phycisphaerales bacterium]